MRTEKIRYVTADGTPIIADYFPVEHPQKFALLSHMMPATKESWSALAEKLTQKNIAVLAPDLRGHGESIADAAGNTLSYASFSDQEHQQSIQDLEGAVNVLHLLGMDQENKQLIVIGASIGANLSLQYAARHAVCGCAAISPGLDYHGIRPLEFIKHIAVGTNVLLMAAADDAYSFQSAEKIFAALRSAKELKTFPRGGHGTTLFDAVPESFSAVLQWAERTVV